MEAVDVKPLVRGKHVLREVLGLFSYHYRSGRRFAEHDCHNVFEKTVRDLKSIGFDEMVDKRVLDLGCGQRFPLALQCASSGARVTALDVNYVKPDMLPLSFYRTLKHDGLKRALKSMLRRLLFDGIYYASLEGASGKNLRSFRSKITFVLADARSGKYPLPSDSYDLVVSNAVVEHVADVNAFGKEIRRLLVRGGLFCANIHNFYSLSGGHALGWAYPDESPSSEVPPWDHLRENRFPSWAYLNRLRPEQYRHAFADHLEMVLFEGRDINHDHGGLEGERFLTPEVEAELAPYSRELLLTRSWSMICRKT
ncbi:MAG: class I SAM-dependent methyltransferase [Thermodesulfobacteriota bacterium]